MEAEASFAFKSVALLSTDVPSPPSPGAPTANLGTFGSPARLLKSPTKGRDTDMEIDSPLRTRPQPVEVAMVDEIKDEDDVETSLDVRKPGDESIIEEEKMDGEAIIQDFDPATPPSVDEPRTPPPVKLPDVVSQLDEDPMEESSPTHHLDWDNSPPRRTLANVPQTSPHFRHNSPAPPRPQSPSFGELAINPKDTVLTTPPLLEPLVTDYSISLYPLPPVPPTPEKNKKEKKDKNKSLELYRWQTSIASTPVAALLRKATKCLSSKEWAVGFSERRFYKAMRQVEVLKSEGRWSFRQPKKSKGPTLPKVHWDYVLDEMRWLQGDFREERKWKTAIAFEIAHEVAAWH
ncbi:chromatin modification- protein VID21 [Tulasnella sp. 427]|nr:chromatin modification- protein VID21 [Tulasnella sp. 427]